MPATARLAAAARLIATVRLAAAARLIATVRLAAAARLLAPVGLHPPGRASQSNSNRNGIADVPNTDRRRASLPNAGPR